MDPSTQNEVAYSQELLALYDRFLEGIEAETHRYKGTVDAILAEVQEHAAQVRQELRQAEAAFKGKAEDVALEETRKALQ